MHGCTTPQSRSPEENWLSHSEDLSITSSSSAWDRTSWSPLPSTLGFCLAWSCSGLVRAVTIIMSSYKQLSYCIQKAQFRFHDPLPLVLIIFLSPLQRRSLTPGSRSIIQTFHLGMRAPMSLTVYLHVDQLWVAMLISINHKNLLIILVLIAKTLDKDYKSCLVRPRFPFNPILHSSHVSIISYGTFLGSSNESLFPLTRRLNDPPLLYVSTCWPCLILLSFRSQFGGHFFSLPWPLWLAISVVYTSWNCVEHICFIVNSPVPSRVWHESSYSED